MINEIRQSEEIHAVLVDVTISLDHLQSIRQGRLSVLVQDVVHQSLQKDIGIDEVRPDTRTCIYIYVCT